MGNLFVRRRPFGLIGVLVLLVALAFPAGAAGHVTTDQADYSPGSVVTISGDNSDGAAYLPGEIVDVVVTGPNGYAASCSATADASGAWSCQTTLWDTSLAVGDYSYTATGETSGFSEKGFFSDGNISVKLAGGPTSASIAYLKFKNSATCSGDSTSGTAVVNNTSFANVVGTGNGQSAKLTAPVIAGYAFNGWTGAETSSNASICVVSETASREIVANYVVATQPTTVSAVSGSGSYRGSAALTAKLMSGATLLAGKSIEFTLGGTAIGSGTTNAAGVATLSGVGLAGYGAGTFTGVVGATFAGDSSYTGNSATGTLTVDKAATTVVVTCPTSVTYSGSAQAPCSATVTGAGSLNDGVVVAYENNTNAGTATATAIFTATGNYNGSSDSKTFEISRATSATAVTCDEGPFVYTGSAMTPCTAKVTGAGGLTQALTVTYANNTNAGTATASAGFGGDANHAASSDSKTFAIGKADSTVVVTCAAGPFTYTGSPLAPCSARATGAGGLSQSLGVTYENNVNAGTASAGAIFAGDDNHNGSTGSATFAIGKAGSSVSVTCEAGPFVYTGSAQTPCSATVTGAGDLDQSVAVTYEDNVNAGIATASASFPGDANHTSSAGSTTFTIGRATSSVTVTCEAGPFVYTGEAQTPCTASVTGAGGLNAALAVAYSDNTNAGSVTASASYAGDANHAGSDGSTTFTIEKAGSSVTVTCEAGPFAYKGSAWTPCSAAASGVAIPDVTGLTVTYEDNVNAGEATASATWAGDDNHNGSTGSATFEIRPAHSAVSVTCPAVAQAYTGSGIEPCSAAYTTEDLLTGSLAVTYSDNVNAGIAGASARYAGDSNHDASSNTGSFTIRPAHSDVVVTCPTTAIVYTGSPMEPCTADYTTEDGLHGSLVIAYSNNEDAGRAGARATYAGDANHDSSNGSAGFEIAKADSAVTLTCPASVVYNAAARTPCSATVTGAGGLNQPVEVTYTENTNAGTAHAGAAYAGDANHDGSSDSKTFIIEKATLTAVFTVASKPFDTTTAATILTESATGQQGTDTCTLTGGTASFDTATVGADKTVTLSGWTLDGTNCGNYQIASSITTKASITAWTAAGHGFYSPVAVGNSVFTAAPNPVPTTVPAGLVWNTVKGGSTVPLKFNVFAGTTEKTDSGDIVAFNQSKMLTCSASAQSDPVDYVLDTTGGTRLRYDTTAKQWIDNWKTSKVSATECWRVWVTFADGSTLESFFQLNK